jgi:hypothetical protein
MNKRGAYGSMAERVGRPRPAGQEASALPIKHCWVLDGSDRLPALLLEWRQVEGTWRGRVVRPVRDDTGWVVVEEWLPAELLSAGG